MQKFKTKIKIIGINPYVDVPVKILNHIFKTAGKNKGPVQVRGEVNGTAFKQTLVRFRGEWRLYINTKMLKHSPKRIGETIHIQIEFDPDKRTIKKHPEFISALKRNPEANAIFLKLRPSLQHEIVRYIASLKTEASVKKNADRAIQFLLGKERFVGRDHP